jgi:hypothetical protein
MRSGAVRGDAALRCPVQETEPEQERLVNILHGLGLFREDRGQRLDPHRPAAKLLHDGCQELAIRAVQTLVVYLESDQCLVGGRRVDAAVAVDLGVIANAAQEPVDDPRRAASAPGDGRRAVRAQLHAEQSGRADDDRSEIRNVVEVEPVRGAKAVTQRARDAAGARRGPHDREGLEGQPQATRRRPLADHHVQGEILHGRVEDLLHGAVEAVDLVDEKDVAFVQRCQDCRQVPCPLDRRTAGVADVGAQLAGNDRGQGRLAQAGRAVQQHMVRGVPSLAGGAEQDRKVGLQLALADVLVECLGPQRPIDGDLDLILHVRGEYSRYVGQRAVAHARIIPDRTGVLHDDPVKGDC